MASNASAIVPKIDLAHYHQWVNTSPWIVAWGVLSLAGTAIALQERPEAVPAKLGTCVLQAESLGEPTGAAFAENGSLYVVESLGRQVSVIGERGETLRRFGGGLLADPRDLAVLADGRVVVSDAGLDAIVIFQPDGKSSRFGSRGCAPGQFNGMEGIDVAGNLVAVADARNDRIQIFELDGKLVRVIGSRGEREGELNRPADVAFAPDGSIFVADLFNQRVQCFSKEGKFLRAFGSPGPNPGQFGGPTGLALHGEFVHVVDRDNSRVQIFTSKGDLFGWYGIHALRPREGEGKLHYPLRVALNRDGTRAAIVEPMENRVQVLGPVDPSVEELPPLPALPPSHFGGAIDADGPLLVLTEPSIPRVLLFQMQDGEPIEFGAFGTYGTRAGQMIWPCDVAIDFSSRRIFVADSGLARIQAFEFRFDPAAEIGFDPERVRFLAEVDLRKTASMQPRASPIDPVGLWRDGEGGLCVADALNRSVWRFDASLHCSGDSRLPETCLEPIDGCAGPRDKQDQAAREQYVVDRLSGTVYALGTGKSIVQGLSRPSAVLLTQAGELYASDEGAHALLRPGRAKPEVARGPGLGATQLFRPRGLAELPGGRVVVLDWGNHRGSIFDREDKFVRAFGSLLFIRPTLANRAAKLPEPEFAPPHAPQPPRMPALDGKAPWHSAKHCVSNAGHFAVFWRPTPDPIQERQGFSLEVWVTALATPNTLATDLELSIDAAMPEHGHGMNVIPQTTRNGDGHFLVEGTRLHMPGRWELYFDIARAGRTERAQLTLDLE